MANVYKLLQLRFPHEGTHTRVGGGAHDNVLDFFRDTNFLVCEALIKQRIESSRSSMDEALVITSMSGASGMLGMRGFNKTMCRIF